MPDAFEELRAPASAVAPDPEFAARLRARLERALALPRGVTPVTATDLEPRNDTTPDTAPDAAPTPAAVPYLAVADARRALDWYADVFGAHVLGDPIEMPDGRIGHAELEVSGGVLYLADEYPEIGVAAPRPGEASVSLMLPVDDADRVRERAMAAGASGDRPPYDAYGTRNAWIVDPFGHRWGLNSPLRARTAPLPAYRQGDVGFVSVWTPDADRAAGFYRAVLGWAYDPDTTLVDHSTPHTSIWATDEDVNLAVQYAVDDMDAALARVRGAGGRHDEPEHREYGVVTRCRDDQDAYFVLRQGTDADTGERPPPNGRRSGDLSYLTLEVVDSARTRAFYGAVLGWEFTPGRIDDGWGVTDTTPMIGISGGHDRARAVPMWSVADIHTAVAAVRANGGTATYPVQQPYGAMSECTDDQGSRFYLGER